MNHHNNYIKTNGERANFYLKTDLEFIFSEHIKKRSKELIKNPYLTFQSS